MNFQLRATKSRKVFLGKLGDVTVRIYKRKRDVMKRGKAAGKRTVFEVADYTTGRRAFRGFSTLEDAATKAESIARLIVSGQAEAAAITNADAATLGRVKEILRDVPTPLELIASRYAEAYKLAGEDKFLEAIRDYARRNPASREPRTVRQVADDFLALKEKRGETGNRRTSARTSERYLEDLRNRLARIAAAFPCRIASVTQQSVQAWLDKMDAAPRTVKNFRDVANALFKYAEARGHITKGENPVAGTERPKAPKGEEITIFTPTELHRLLEAAPKSFQPVIALQAFAGLRSSEVRRIHWADVKFDRGHIEVAAHKAKTASRRLVPITGNLAQWLAPHSQRKTGKVFPHSRAYFHELQRDTAARTGREANPKKQITALAPVEWKHNALRHSFISYRVADIQNVPQVALESGNSPAMIFANYRELVTPADAKAWFAIAPQQSGKIITLPAATAAAK